MLRLILTINRCVQDLHKNALQMRCVGALTLVRGNHSK